ncbi:trypsin-like peptidase domain-containing protein [Streptomyces sp. NPDC019531]|uniref:trypsin-like peptidase domain-containing protein n=1 Tax=Streptomyces sp. NPDC019531 TaxID=3365062 RepID=UPI00384E5AF4
MNEGKPTKAKRWSRRRPQGGPGRAGEAATPTPAPTGSDGDFELQPPEGGGTAAAGAGARVAEGDFELRPPQGSSTTDGDYELARPAVALPTGGSGPAVPAVEPAVDHPEPRHDSGSAGTPPYGVPGPWAPAPPVQHPATTPAHGTPTPTLSLSPPTSASPSHDKAVPTAAAAGEAPVPAAPHPDAPTRPPAVDAPPPTGLPSTALPPEPPGPGTPPASTPWQNYDPWAPVRAPLQQNGAAVGSQETRRRRVRRGLVGGAAVLALVAGGVGGVVGAYLERNGVGGDVVELPQAEEESGGRAPDSVAGIAARALPSVVTLHVSGTAESGTGTGFVLDDRGHILTNNHVVEPAGADGEISVTFQSGDTAKATVVGRDSGYDLAVVKVSGVRGLRPMTLGNSDNVQVGDPVVAIGAPFDLEGTVTSGIISAKERPITAGDGADGTDVSYVDALQTDAPINPGNSGGPLLDSRARVIGINSAIRSADEGSGSESGQAGSIGLGFAIPVNQAKRVAEELINTGKATHPVIGVTLDMDYTGDGARVGTKGGDGGPAVTEGGPGDEAGLEAGDVITEVDGRRIHSGDELIIKTRAHRPGDRLRLTLERDGNETTVSLTLGSSDGS